MSTEAAIQTVIPDLRDLTVDQLAELGASGSLAQSIQRYRERLKERGIPLSSFQARI